MYETSLQTNREFTSTTQKEAVERELAMAEDVVAEETGKDVSAIIVTDGVTAKEMAEVSGLAAVLRTPIF